MNRSSLRLPGRRTAQRALWLRLFAALLTLILWSAQQRTTRAERWVPSSAAQRFSQRSESAENSATRATATSLPIAKAPLLERLPAVPYTPSGARAPSSRLLIAGADVKGRAQLVTHFHAKRRIPRMNSEEPPRA